MGLNKGKYINLEFVYLQELSTLDMYFRKIILKMTIDIEHFLKTQMIKDFSINDKEDGYSIIARILRNAAAHNNCLLNSLRKPYTRKISHDWKITKYISQIPGIAKDSRTKKMDNPVIYDFIVMLHLFNLIVSSDGIRNFTMAELRDLVINRFTKHIEYISNNEVIKSNFNFLGKVVDFYSKARV